MSLDSWSRRVTTTTPFYKPSETIEDRLIERSNEFSFPVDTFQKEMVAASGASYRICKELNGKLVVIPFLRQKTRSHGSGAIVQGGIDYRASCRTHYLVVMRAGQPAESQRYCPATRAHDCVVIHWIEESTYRGDESGCAVGGSSIHITDRSHAGSPAVRSPKSMMAERRPDATSRLPG